MSYPTSVPLITDGQDVNAAVANPPIVALTQRTDWLKSQLAGITSGSQLTLRNQTIATGVVAGTPVFWNATTNRFEAAKADIVANSFDNVSDSGYWQGLVAAVTGVTADIVLMGQLTLSEAAWAGVIPGSFTPGLYYLDEAAAGKLSTSPGSLGIYVGCLRADGSFLVRGGSINPFMNHAHIKRTLVGTPAGGSPNPGLGNPQVITPVDSGERGWLPVLTQGNVDAYFPGFQLGVQVPTGAVYGYNLQHVDEADLRAIFPPLPDGSAQLSQAGLLLSDDKVIVNRYGIWWMDNSYGNAPWPVDYDVALAAPNIEVWVTRILAQASLVELVGSTVIADLRNGGIDDIAASAILAGTGVSVVGTAGDAVNGWKGKVTVASTGPSVLRRGYGVGLSGTGNDTAGYTGDVTLTSTVERPATLLYNTEGAAVPLTTNGVSSGAALGVYAHPLGISLADDYIDFGDILGDDLISGHTYSVSIRVSFAVDMPAGAEIVATFPVALYRIANNSPASSSAASGLTTVVATTGAPGRVQVRSANFTAALPVQRYDQLIFRVRNPTSGLPLGSLRVLNLSYRLTRIP